MLTQSDIKKLTTIEDCENAIKFIEKHKKELMQQVWADNYSDKCGDKFIPLEDVLNFMNFDRCDKTPDISHNELIERCEDIKPLFYHNGVPAIDALIELLSIMELGISDKGVQDMICAACVCKGCTSCLSEDAADTTNNDVIIQAEHCNGISCTECKKNRYTGYDNICEE